MKNKLFLIVAVVVFGYALSSCASTKILTLKAIDDDIDGLENLDKCQFWISKEVTLSFSSNDKQTEIDKRGTVKAQRVIAGRRIKIARLTRGVLRTRNNVSGHNMDDIQNDGSEPFSDIWVLFENDNDNAIHFRAWQNRENGIFQLWDNEVNYGGLTYTISYDGDERPYLYYKLIERKRKDSAVRRVSGRRVNR